MGILAIFAIISESALLAAKPMTYGTSNYFLVAVSAKPLGWERVHIFTVRGAIIFSVGCL
jgi:hypothetical protein